MTKTELEENFFSAQSGNEEAFGRIYDYYYDKLSSYVYRRVLSTEITEDIVSNTFFKALKHLKRFKWKGAAEFNGWMYRIATNEVNTYFRKRDRYTFSPPEDLENYFADSSENTSLHDGVTKDIDLKNDFAEISGIIQGLKPLEQTIIHLRFFEEMPLAEIATVVHKSENAVTVTLHRALKKIKGRAQKNSLSHLS